MRTASLLYIKNILVVSDFKPEKLILIVYLNRLEYINYFALVIRNLS
jgi:hypothetical protein